MTSLPEEPTTSLLGLDNNESSLQTSWWKSSLNRGAWRRPLGRLSLCTSCSLSVVLSNRSMNARARTHFAVGLTYSRDGKLTHATIMEGRFDRVANNCPLCNPERRAYLAAHARHSA